MMEVSPPEPIMTLRWRTGLIGFLLPIMGGGVVMFGIAAFKPSLAAELADGRRGAWISATSEMTFGGVNIPLALLALYFGWEFFRFGWRWADEFAVRATTVGLVPHRSTLIKPIPWGEIADISYSQFGRASSLVIKFRDGRSRIIRGVSNDGGAAESFAVYARNRIMAANQVLSADAKKG
ncbi:hypothetical protein CLG96_05535 [Sphingomonas oleivorans]|uniref:Uncharacterized protein n=1 Tax=Sphingomonas oleivorans TaxID=1735121 RepID=A0A2T5FZA4_9SPHN|nr:hypothetical protein [Sphingomonas oleivorans]PTQ12040.1 hypothetical protein CLG96_05535 [Sphingomonas oleivorans]